MAPLPTIHLNGTSKSELFKQQLDVLRALRAAHTALCEAAPHGRDYYPQGPGALEVAMARHIKRISTIDDMIVEIEITAIAISNA